MITTVCYSLAALALLILFAYLKTVSSIRRAAFELYEVRSRFRATMSTLVFPWRVILAMKEDLARKDRALELARRLGIDVDDLLRVVEEEVIE